MLSLALKQTCRGLHPRTPPRCQPTEGRPAPGSWPSSPRYRLDMLRPWWMLGPTDLRLSARSLVTTRSP